MLSLRWVQPFVHLTNGSNPLHFFYDAQNKPAVVVFNGTAYAYLYNLQGAVIGLVDVNGSKVVEYRYDAWGRIMSRTGAVANTLGVLNPFRYRGYVYDEETGMYYLRSRYYNTSWVRYISLDSIYHGNLFCYCTNSPISLQDFSGKSACMAHYTMIMMDGSSGNGTHTSYPNYGVSADIAKTIDIILSDSQSWAYSKRGSDGKYIYGVQPEKNTTRICCAYLMLGIMGGSKGVPGRRNNCVSLQKLTSLDQLKPGMEIFQRSRHCGPRGHV